MKKCVVIVLAVVALAFVYKKTNVGSYVGTVLVQAKKEAQDQVPTRLEIERVRYEIANLDNDVGNMIRPIAEHMTGIAKLKKDIETAQAGLEKERAVLVKMTDDLACNPTQIEYGGKMYSPEYIRGKLQRDFATFKQLEAKLESQRKLLELKQSSLQSAHEQLAKVQDKKREYEIRLAQLEADEEQLQTARIGTPFKLDDSRASQIERDLAEIAKRQSIQRNEIELKTGALVSDNIPVLQQKQPVTDVAAIRRYLEAPTGLVVNGKVNKD